MEPKRSGNSGRYLRVFELALRVWVVVRDAWLAIGFGHAQIGHQQRHRLGGHRGATVGVDGQIAGHDALLSACIGDQALGQLGGFAGSHHPAHHVSAEDVQDDVEVEVDPLGRAQQLRDIPAPDLIGARSQQFRLLVLRMPKLVASLLQLAVLSQDAMHGADRAEINAFIDQGGKDLRRRLVPEAFRVQMIEHQPALRRMRQPKVMRSWIGWH